MNDTWRGRDVVVVRVRKATEADILGIQQVAHIAWQSTYEDSMRPDTRAQVLAEFYSEKSLRRSLQREDALFLLAEENDKVIGFAQALPHPLDGYEVARVYLLPAFQRQGIGSRLQKEIIKRLPRNSLWAFVERTNRGAIDFFQYHGFRRRREVELPLFGETLFFVELKRI